MRYEIKEHATKKERTLAYNDSTTFPTCSSVPIAAPYVFCDRNIRESITAIKNTREGGEEKDERKGTYVCFWFVIDKKASAALVKDAVEDLFKDRLK
jgi:hypothetical protein